MTSLAPLPTLEAAEAALRAVNPEAYARTRNHLTGAVTGLSPYLTHGLLTVPQCMAALGLPPQHKLAYEFGWREFFRHVWAHRGDAIFDSLHDGPLPEQAYCRDVPADICTAATGVPVVDEAVRTLYRTGLLHNHARMWLASYVVHGRKVHWRAGADWLYSHLLDGDLASNHLSWQWVAATGSHKPYVFDAANVARFAPPPWHSEGSAVDLSYDAWDTLARTPRALPAGDDRAAASAVPEPVCTPSPAIGGPVQAGLPDPAAFGRDARPIWLAHPWALGPAPADTQTLAVVLREAHQARPWSEPRWHWVTERMTELGGTVWVCDAAALAAWVDAVTTAGQRPERVQAVAEPHITRWLPPGIALHPAPRHFPEVAPVCASFSAWWRRASGEALPRRPHGGD
ncbi:FAD-binding domain-containing protein [Roseateles sp. BYS87W]|uniref:FAD-binding domain-containing protein n=1 Tax=Pelomonas baiyunensis TaxID=3299026 RepID=A0ABW7GY48_9BURK